MRSPYDFIRSPLITEKTTAQKAMSNAVSFKVDIRATKVQIRNAVSKIFGVKVLDVKTMKIKGKMKRLGRYSGKRPDWKKAIVKLEPGAKIEYFEGV